MSKELNYNELNYNELNGAELTVEVIKRGPIVALATASTLIEYLAARSGLSFDDVLEEIRTLNRAIVEQHGEFHA